MRQISNNPIGKLVLDVHFELDLEHNGIRISGLGNVIDCVNCALYDPDLKLTFPGAVFCKGRNGNEAIIRCSDSQIADINVSNGVASAIIGLGKCY